MTLLGKFQADMKKAAYEYHNDITVYQAWLKEFEPELQDEWKDMTEVDKDGKTFDEFCRERYDDGYGR